MWGSLDKDFYFMMRFNVEGVTENVRVCSEFIKYICLAGIVLAVVIVWLISRRVTKPLHELTELSNRMAELILMQNIQAEEAMRSDSWASISTGCQRIWKKRIRSF